MFDALQQEIEDINPADLEKSREAVLRVIQLLDLGELRVSSPIAGEWQVHSWVKQAILYYFQLMPMELRAVGEFTYNDKIPLKQNYRDLKVRVVPPATARYGSFMEAGVVLMPSYINIGAWVGRDTMVDTWATVGSGAQIGAEVHLAGGVGIGGVLEPVQALPVIIEDGAFIGSRAIVVEGVRVGREAVLAAQVSLSASTPIIDIRNEEWREYRGYVPDRAVVVPGTRTKKVSGGEVQLSCAYIIGERHAGTDRKVSLNEVLREFKLSV